MKAIVFFFLTVVTLVGYGQTEYDYKNEIGFACGYGGVGTYAVTEVEKLLAKHKYNKVASLLYSETPADQYLAVVVLKYLQENEIYNLSEKELLRIFEIKNSVESFKVCSGCTYHDFISLEKAFTKINLLGTDEWLDKVISK